MNLKPAPMKRCRRVFPLLRADEDTAMRQAAEREGLSVSTWIRIAVMEKLRRMNATQTDTGR